ncbi:MAG: LamG-like jellyroll fold domain-containing protein [bacterium]
MKKLFTLLFGIGFLLIPTASAYALSPSLSSGLVSYWKLDEVSGNAADATSTNTLLNNNSVIYVSGKFHNAASFDGLSSQSLSISDTSQSGLNFASGAPFSFGFWMKAALPTDGFDKAVFSKINTGGGYSLSLENGGWPHARIGSLLLQNEISPQSSTYSDHIYGAPSTLNDNLWHHVVVTYDGSLVTMYVDGTKVVDRIVGAISGSSTEDFMLGFGVAKGAHDYFDGQLDEVGVWGRALSDSDVTDLYNSYANTAPTASGASLSTNEDTGLSITLPGSDVDGDTLSFATTSNPTHGTLSTLVGSTTIYTPDANYNGTDSFDYVVGDGLATTSSATVSLTINAVNDPPILVPISSQTATSGDTVIFTATSTDVDGGAPIYSIASSSVGTSAATIDSTTGAFSWVTTGVAAGSYTFTISVSDGSAVATTTASIAILTSLVPPAPTPTPPVSPTPGASGGGVIGGGSLSVGYKNVANFVNLKPSTTSGLAAIQKALPPIVAPQTPPESPVATKTSAAPVAIAPPVQVSNPQSEIVSANSPQNLLTSTNSNQLASPVASGFNFHVPLWVCGVGATAAAGVGAWWWLGLAL